MRLIKVRKGTKGKIQLVHTSGLTLKRRLDRVDLLKSVRDMKVDFDSKLEKKDD